MVCPNCGKEVASGTRFCESCGAKLEEQSTQNSGYYASPVQSAPQPQASVYREPVTAGGYILRYLISLIPVVGWIIYIVMLFVWAGDKTKEESFNNWAKAQLILMLIGVVITILCFAVFGAALGSLFNGMSSYM